jgi:hypothetical protein
MRARARLALVVTTLVTATLGSLGLTPTASAAVTPKVGQCHQLTRAQAWAVSDTKKPVPCSARHNLQTIAVVTSPTSLAGLSADEQAEIASRLCQPKWTRMLGRTATVREQTAYGLFFFSPTAAQAAAGARRIRCDLGLVAVSRLSPLPKKRLSRPIIGSHIDDAERRCMTARWWVTPCSHKHAHRSIAAFVVRTSAYPTGEQLVAAANRKCPKTWDNVMPPSERGWEHGNHVAVCYDKTRR